MKHIITALVAVICIALGGFAGHYLKTAAAASETGGPAGAAPEKAASKDEAGASKPAAGAKGGHGKTDAGRPASGDVMFYKFSREFVVPILKEERVESLVILNINLEADASISQQLFKLEPKLRDNIMTTLIQLSNDGRTFETITDVESYETVRALILKNLENVIAEGIHNVLILDMAKQNL